MAGSSEQFERFVDADEAAEFLSLTRRRVLDLTRKRRLPGHPIGNGTRRVWRFRLSELATALLDQGRFRFAPRPGHSMVRPQAVTDDAKGG
jgi:excisionase family DNA binding protein